nr:MAG: MC152.1R [Molluscum contagiosum virus]
MCIQEYPVQRHNGATDTVRGPRNRASSAIGVPRREATRFAADRAGTKCSREQVVAQALLPSPNGRAPPCLRRNALLRAGSKACATTCSREHFVPRDSHAGQK